MQTSLLGIDYGVMLVYLIFVLGVGFALKRMMKSSDDFFLSGRSIPAWITGLAFISANLGAQEVIGMGAMGAQYGILTSHFYWIGAIPAMIFVGIFMMPFYYGSRARSVPEYLKLRYDEKTRGFNAITFAVMTVLSSGISMMVMAKLIMMLHMFDAIFKWMKIDPKYIFDASVIVSALIVLCYIFLGGLTSAIYNEVLQFFLIVFGFLPLVLLGLHDIGGWEGLKHSLETLMVQRNAVVDAAKALPVTAYTHSWAGMGHAATNLFGVEWFGLAMGLGFVLSFGYWCTDFLVVQRAMAADSMSAARRTPLIAAIPKMLFPLLVIVPGMIALVAGSKMTHPVPGITATAVVQSGKPDAIKSIIPVVLDEATGKPKVDPKTGQPEIDPATKMAKLDYNMATPSMLLRYFPAGLLGLGLAALLASFMSGMAGNVTAFNTVWTYDIYHSYINKKATDRGLLWMGRFATVFGILISVGAAYWFKNSKNIMENLQMVFGFVNAPLFATFALGMFWRRSTGHGAFFGLLAGTLAAAVHAGITANPDGAGFMKITTHTYPSGMAQNFWMAIWAFGICFLTTIVISMFTQPRAADELRGLVYSLTPKPVETERIWWRRPAALAIFVLVLTLALNFLFF